MFIISLIRPWCIRDSPPLGHNKLNVISKLKILTFIQHFFIYTWTDFCWRSCGHFSVCVFFPSLQWNSIPLKWLYSQNVAGSTVGIISLKTKQSNLFVCVGVRKQIRTGLVQKPSIKEGSSRILWVYNRRGSRYSVLVFPHKSIWFWVWYLWWTQTWQTDISSPQSSRRCHVAISVGKQIYTLRQATVDDSWNPGGASARPSLAGRTPPPSDSAWTLYRGRRLLHLVGSLYCQAPLPSGPSLSLILINILLEAFHYRLPPKHLWFWTPDTSPSIPPG